MEAQRRAMITEAAPLVTTATCQGLTATLITRTEAASTRVGEATTRVAITDKQVVNMKEDTVVTTAVTMCSTASSVIIMTRAPGITSQATTVRAIIVREVVETMISTTEAILIMDQAEATTSLTTAIVADSAAIQTLAEIKGGTSRITVIATNKRDLDTRLETVVVVTTMRVVKVIDMVVTSIWDLVMTADLNDERATVLALIRIEVDTIEIMMVDRLIEEGLTHTTTSKEDHLLLTGQAWEAKIISAKINSTNVGL